LTSFQPGLNVDGNERAIPVFSLCCDRSEIVFNEFHILGLSNEFLKKIFKYRNDNEVLILMIWNNFIESFQVLTLETLFCIFDW
jgi:hypothetical protein